MRQSADLSVGGQQGNNDWWHVNLGPLAARAHAQYAIEVVDGTGASHWDSNGGSDHHAYAN